MRAPFPPPVPPSGRPRRVAPGLNIAPEPPPEARPFEGLFRSAAREDVWTIERSRWSRLRRLLTPSRLLVLSFLGLILMGTLGLEVLPGLYTGPRLSLFDALFTATSAVCVTGLIVVDTATYFTGAGQLYLLLLIQLGGLGILTLTTMVITALGRRLSLHHEAVLSTTADITPEVDFRQLVRSIVVFTLGFEVAGAVVLFVSFKSRFPAPEAAWHAIFHSISAFCNAGFSTFSTSLIGFQGAPVVLVTLMLLIVVGGIGFLTLEEVNLRWRRENVHRVRLSLHSRLVLIVTALLLVGGWAAFTALEWGALFGGMPAWERVLNGLFMSVTARTAGFNSIDYVSASDGSIFTTILLMAIGGSPGSTAGGLKTTTVAVIGLVALARLRGHARTSFMKRTLPEETVQGAVGLFVVAFGVMTAAILLYAVVQLPPFGTGGERGFLVHMFEAVSAFNTVGLSMGATGELTAWGKALTIVLMYVGRVGPLTVAAAIALERRNRASEFRYAYEDVIIG